jgi:hypothetical protein
MAAGKSRCCSQRRPEMCHETLSFGFHRVAVHPAAHYSWICPRKSCHSYRLGRRSDPTKCMKDFSPHHSRPRLEARSCCPFAAWSGPLLSVGCDCDAMISCARVGRDVKQARLREVQAYRDAKDVRGQILEGLGSRANRLGMDHPVFAPNALGDLSEELGSFSARHAAWRGRFWRALSQELESLA